MEMFLLFKRIQGISAGIMQPMMMQGWVWAGDFDLFHILKKIAHTPYHKSGLYELYLVGHDSDEKI